MAKGTVSPRTGSMGGAPLMRERRPCDLSWRYPYVGENLDSTSQV